MRWAPHCSLGTSSGSWMRVRAGTQLAPSRTWGQFDRGSESPLRSVPRREHIGGSSVLGVIGSRTTPTSPDRARRSSGQFRRGQTEVTDGDQTWARAYGLTEVLDRHRRDKVHKRTRGRSERPWPDGWKARLVVANALRGPSSQSIPPTQLFEVARILLLHLIRSRPDAAHAAARRDSICTDCF
jgi:hypothetical protein